RVSDPGRRRHAADCGLHRGLLVALVGAAVHQVDRRWRTGDQRRDLSVDRGASANMNLLDSRVVLRLRTVPDILDLAFRVLFAGNHRLYLRLAAVTLVPALAACLALRYLADWKWLDVWLFAIGLGSLLQGLFTVAAGQLLFSESVKAR